MPTVEAVDVIAAPQAEKCPHGWPVKSRAEHHDNLFDLLGGFQLP